jgi:predicted DNA binding protein
MAINKKHQQQNGDLIKDNIFYKKKAEHYQIMSDQLKKELEELKKKTVSVLTEFRNKGDV